MSLDLEPQTSLGARESKLPLRGSCRPISLGEQGRKWNFAGEGAESDSMNPAGHLGNAGLQLGGGKLGRLVGMWAELGVG